ncbi:MAG: sulfotransferase [Gammaproteobacteria bacterium]|nr:sulfotransferase [Gammaproteobacteria bacterium]
MKVLYLTSSSFSGSTLLAFLLNAHPEITTVSEMIGWQYGQDEIFDCSCGKALPDCPFFRNIARAFQENGIPFDFRQFGTGYSLVGSETLNRYLTECLPLIRNSPLERVRDALVMAVPTFAKTLKQQDFANRTFINTALKYSHSSVFIDASKDPHRMRHLSRINEFDLRVLYLVRDPRGVSRSTMKTRKWDAARAIEWWIRDQQNILRISTEFSSVLPIYYEDLCDAVDDTLGEIHRFVDLQAETFCGDFMASEHHILGNSMRLTGQSNIQKNERWREELSRSDINTITGALNDFVAKNPQHKLSAIITRYLN